MVAILGLPDPDKVTHEPHTTLAFSDLFPDLISTDDPNDGYTLVERAPTTRCPSCGKFAKWADIYYVYGPMPYDGPDHEACMRCHPHSDQIARQRKGTP